MKNYYRVFYTYHGERPRHFSIGVRAVDAEGAKQHVLDVMRLDGTPLERIEVTEVVLVPEERR